MRFLRTISTQRLLAIIAGVVIAAAGGTAIAVAASGSGRVPPRESLAQAVHQAAAAPQVSGISARIHFTNHLIGASNLQGTDPILSGASGRLWVSNDGRLRVELQGQSGDAQVALDKNGYSIYDPMSNTVYKGSLPAGSSSAKDKKTGADALPSIAQIQSELNRLMQNVNVVGPLPRNVAGQPAYKVVISPKHDGGLLGNIQLAWDAAHGVPLGIAIYAQGNHSPVLELKATDVSYGAVARDDLAIQPPAGAKTVKVSPTATGAAAKHGATARGKHQADVTGPAAVQAHLPFTLAARSSLVGLSRQSVELLDWGGSPAALVTYGQGLGAIAVIEQPASSAKGSAPSKPQGGGDRQGLTLPTVRINNRSSGQELATALGTVIRYTSGQVEYTVLGSVPAAAAEAAAKALTP
jgi:outer membrane lipoprotein-sorting protein